MVEKILLLLCFIPAATSLFLPKCGLCCAVPLLDLASANAGMDVMAPCTMNKDTLTPAQHEVCVAWFASGCPHFCPDGSKPVCGDKSAPVCADKTPGMNCVDGSAPACTDKTTPTCASLDGSPPPKPLVGASVPAKCPTVYSDAACATHCKRQVGICVDAASVPDLFELFSSNGPASSPKGSGASGDAAAAGASGAAAPKFREMKTELISRAPMQEPSVRDASFRPGGARAVVGGHRLKKKSSGLQN